MNPRKQSPAFCLLLLLSTIFFVSGCATTDRNLTVKAANSIYFVDSEIKNMVVQIDATSASLDSLTGAGQADLAKAFGTYSLQLDKLDSEGQKVVKRSEEMRKASIKYFKEWEKVGDVYSHPRVNRLSEVRRDELAEVYVQVALAGLVAKKDFLNCMTNLQAIKKELSRELTLKRVESMSPDIKKAVQEMDALKNSFKPIVSGLEDIKMELYMDIK